MDKNLQTLADQFENFVLSFQLVSDKFRYISKECGNFINKKYILQLSDPEGPIASKYIRLELNEDRGEFETATLSFGFLRKKVDMRARSAFKKEIVSILNKYDVTFYSNNFSSSSFSCKIHRDTNLYDLANEIFSK